MRVGSDTAPLSADVKRVWTEALVRGGRGGGHTFVLGCSLGQACDEVALERKGARGCIGVRTHCGDGMG